MGYDDLKPPSAVQNTKGSHYSFSRSAIEGKTGKNAVLPWNMEAAAAAHCHVMVVLAWQGACCVGGAPV